MTDEPAREPYVGPSAFERGDAEIFFGREGEARELRSMVVAHRVTLLYAPSGTGKTSLINAGLLPLVEDEFEVLAPARLATAALDPGPPTGNAYAQALLRAWGADAEPGQRLAEWLATRAHIRDAAGYEAPRLVIIDQLEELFTVLPGRTTERRAFLEQVAEAVAADPLLRVVFGLREDYLAEFDSHEELFGFDGVRARLRLELLSREEAIEAVQGPPAALGTPLAPALAEAVVDDLRRFEVKPGEFVISDVVEPFHLQLVCQELWPRLNRHDPEQDAIAAVSAKDALARLYTTAVSDAARAADLPVTRIRDWIESELITSLGTRASVVRTEDETEGLPNAAIDALEARRLIRGEHRLRARWYELSHDRLIDTVRAANRRVEDRIREQLPSEPVEAGFAAAADDRAASGTALCLTGIGYRGALFQAGVLWRLNELGYLPRIDRFAAVSGAAVTAAHLGLVWSRLSFGADGVAQNLYDLVVAPLRELARKTLDTRAALAGILRGHGGRRLAHGLRGQLFGDATLADLPDAPSFVLTATSLQTGGLWRFSKPYMADAFVGRIPHPHVTIADAVVASSASPPVTLVLDLDPDAFAADTAGWLKNPSFRRRAYLVDGSLSDPLAIEAVWKRFRTVLISDGAGVLQPIEEPGGMVAQIARSFSLATAQTRNLRKRQAVAGFVSGEREGAFWAIAGDIGNQGLADALAAPFDRTRELARVPGRFARLDDGTQERLINWGYAACDAAMRRHVVPDAPRPVAFPYPASGV